MALLDTALADLRRFDELASRDTALVRVDPRAKVLTTLVFVVVVASYPRHAVSALLPLTAFPWLLAVLGEVPASLIARKLLVAAPLALMVALPQPWLEPARVAWPGGVQAAAGWAACGSILLRVVLTVSSALVLVAGTGMVPLCVALSRLGVPRLFTTQLLLLWRYAFVLGDEARRMVTAHALRAAGRGPSWRAFGPLVGHLLLRALERAGRLHDAMRARGFDGELRLQRRLHWRAGDTAFVVGWCSVFVLARAVDLPRALGHVLVQGR